MTHAEASVAATSASHAAELPTLDSLFLFLESLRESGFRIDGRQIAAAERLLLDAHAGGPASDAGRRLKYRLAPAIAKSEAEQEDFYRRFDTWNGPVQSAWPAAEKPRARWTAWRLRGMIALLALLLIAGALAIARLVGPGPPEPPAVVRPAAPPPGQAIDLPGETFQASEKLVSPYYPAARIAIALLPIIAFAGWMQRRWRKRVMFMTRGSIVRDLALMTVPTSVDLLKALFTSGDFRKSAQDLRKHRYLPTRKLDVDRTVDATVRRAGLFDPVYRDRAQLPEYVFLIEQNGANDHLARLFDLAVARLHDEHVFIECYYFQTDPRHLQDVARASSLTTLSELAARTDDHRLFVIGSADGFFHPLTGEVENWVASFEPWTARTLLSTRPLEQWTLAELRLLEEGFSLATSETSGFVKTGEKLAFGDDAAELLEGVIVKRPVPRKPVVPPSWLHAIVARRWRVALWLSGFMLVAYYGFILLVAFDRPLLSTLLTPGLSLGILLGALVIVFAWVLTFIYVYWANTTYDHEIHELAHLRGRR